MQIGTCANFCASKLGPKRGSKSEKRLLTRQYPFASRDTNFLFFKFINYKFGQICTKFAHPESCFLSKFDRVYVSM